VAGGKSESLNFKLVAILIFLLIVLSAVHLSTNFVDWEVFKLFRLPRLLSLIVAASSVAISTTILQIMTTPVADSYAFGAPAGALLLFALTHSKFALFLGGVVFITLVVWIAHKFSLSPMQTLVFGMVVSSVLYSVTSIWCILTGQHSILAGIYFTNPEKLSLVELALPVGVLLISIASLLIFSRDLALLAFKRMGLSFLSTRKITFIFLAISGILAANSLYTIGSAMFIGLVVANYALSRFKPQVAPYIAALVAANLMLASDIVCIKFHIEITSLLSIISGGWFIWLMLTKLRYM